MNEIIKEHAGQFCRRQWLYQIRFIKFYSNPMWKFYNKMCYVSTHKANAVKEEKKNPPLAAGTLKRQRNGTQSEYKNSCEKFEFLMRK